MAKGEEHRYFDKEFKYEAFRLMDGGKRSVRDIAKEMKRKIKHVESFKQENQVKISYDLWQLSNDDRKRLAENMWEKFWIYKEKKKGFSFNVEYQKHGLVTILDQLIKEGKLPSLNLNSRCRFGIYQSLYWG